MQSIGDLPGGPVSAVATACSYGGGVMAGYSRSENTIGSEGQREAFRWTSDGMVGLGDLEGGSFHSVVTDMNADGSVIVGYSRTSLDDEAFIWDGPFGMRNLREVLAREYGLAMQLGSWLLVGPAYISADARAICGNGVNPDGRGEAWVVYLDGIPPPPCPADFNNDDCLNSQDFFDFLLCFFDPLACPPLAADFNTDGTVTTQDFFDFLEAFFAGCP
jgi:hypothetical protein